MLLAPSCVPASDVPEAPESLHCFGLDVGLRLARGAGPPRMTKQRPEARDPPPALGGCVACPGAAVMETGRARRR